MLKCLNTVVNSVTQMRKQIYPTKINLPQSWHRTVNTVHGTSEKILKDILKKRFPQATAIKVQDVSGGCGMMYNVYVETNEFRGISIQQQHRTIYEALSEQIKLMHGIHVVTKIPRKANR